MPYLDPHLKPSDQSLNNSALDYLKLRFAASSARFTRPTTGEPKAEAVVRLVRSGQAQRASNDFGQAMDHWIRRIRQSAKITANHSQRHGSGSAARKKFALRERFTAPFSHIFSVLKMCENVEIRRFFASVPTFSHIFKTEKMWKNGVVKRSLTRTRSGSRLRGLRGTVGAMGV